MRNFEWQTDSEYDWDDQPIEVNSAEKTRRTPYLFLIFFLLLLVGSVVYWQVRKSVNAATAAIEVELAATVGLFNRAAQTGDIDLVVSMLSGSDEQWAEGIQLSTRVGGFLDRREFGMQLISAEPISTQITLSPDLLSAEITTTVAYAIDVGNRLTETILLKQPALYRKGANLWLFAPPSADYWGTRVTRDTAFGEAVYYERDRLLIEKLLRDLNLAFIHSCTGREDAACTNPQIQLTFSISPPIIALQATQGSPVLPTPTLIGLPTDRVSYQALLDGYARYILY